MAIFSSQDPSELLAIFRDYSNARKPETLAFSVAIALVFPILLLKLWRFAFPTVIKKVPPGHFGLPFIGETLDFLGTQKRNRSWDFVDKRIGKYGEIFKTNLIGDPTVVASNPAGNKMIFTGENKTLHVSWPGSVIDVLGKQSLIALTGNESKRIRSAVMTFLRPEALSMYVGKADSSVREFVREHWEGQEQVMVFALMKRFAFSMACEILMSRHEKQEHEMLEEPFTTMMKGILQLPIKLPGTRYSKAITAANLLRARFQLWVEERRRDLEEGKATHDQDLLSYLLTFKDETGKPLTDEDIKDNILLLLFAGHDTSTVVTSMVCKFLGENPSILEDVWAENKEISAEKAPDESLTWSDLQRMKLSWRVVQETMRLQPPVQGAFRVAIKEFEYQGFIIPKSWKVYWSTNSTHRNPKHFVEPSKFDPSRFEGAGPPPYTFVPFGGGPRMCPGNEFARMEALVLLHHLVLRFKWTLVDPLEEISVDPMPYFKKGLPIRLESRTGTKERDKCITSKQDVPYSESKHAKR